jgi:hypothetical protein
VVDVGIRFASTTREKAPIPRSRTTVHELFKTAPHSHSDVGVLIVGVLADIGDADISLCKGEVFKAEPKGARGVMADSDIDVAAANVSRARDSGSIAETVEVQSRSAAPGRPSISAPEVSVFGKCL